MYVLYDIFVQVKVVYVLITASIESAAFEPLNMTPAEVTWVDSLKFVCSPFE